MCLLSCGRIGDDTRKEAEPVVVRLAPYRPVILISDSYLRKLNQSYRPSNLSLNWAYPAIQTSYHLDLCVLNRFQIYRVVLIDILGYFIMFVH